MDDSKKRKSTAAALQTLGDTKQRREVAVDVDDVDDERHETTALEKLHSSISKQTDVSMVLAEHLISTEAKGSNFVFLPLSMRVMLCMVAAGSSGRAVPEGMLNMLSGTTSGPTRDQLLDYLNSKSVDDLNSLSSHVATLLFADGGSLGGPRLTFADGVWLDKSLALSPAFKQIVENDYKATTKQEDFQKKSDKAREKVNGWAEKETNGLIKDLLPPGSVDTLTRLVFANALFFKGAWAEKFDESKTKHRKFFLSDGTIVRAPFMESRKRQHIRSFEGFKVLRLPYEQGDDKSRKFSMLIYLPDARDGLPALVEKFGSVPGFLENHLPCHYLAKVGDFRVPKFKINFGFEAAKKALEGQGLVLPLLNETGGGDLEVSSFFHKSCIEVDEKGTEAAAASGLVAGSCCSRFMPVKGVDFVANHPFLFVVREDVGGGVLFVGQLQNPLA